ncbi:MAG: hypothetical protein WCG25_02755 [bacterium]
MPWYIFKIKNTTLEIIQIKINNRQIGTRKNGSTSVPSGAI